MVALIVGLSARIVSANLGETGGYLSLVRSMNPAIGPGLKGIPFCSWSVIRVCVREAVVDGGETSKAARSEGSGDEGMSGMCGSFHLKCGTCLISSGEYRSKGLSKSGGA
jgi:hypothetical protein